MTDQMKRVNKVLVAEDDAVSRRMLEAFLTKWGYQVVTATNGSDALKILEAEDAPSLAVLDWMMPGLEGPQVCQRVREHSDRPYVYLLLLTARSQKVDILRGLESGADDYLTKPFDTQELRARLQVGQRILDLQNGLIAAQDELRFRATHDLLTGIANRGVVLAAIHREHARQLREGGSLGLIMVDLDHFKRVNDTHGHPAGDAVLKEVARRMTACARPYDTVGRYGGEEFLVVVASADGVGALALAERIRREIASTPIPTGEGPVQITASCGVAVSEAGKPLDSEELLHAADEALYGAKQQGRNRVVLAVPPAPVHSEPSLVEPARLKSNLR